MARLRRTPPSVPGLYDPSPGVRLEAVRALKPKDAHRLQAAVTDWPTYSPGAVNAWLLLVTTKAPQWPDPLVPWPEGPLSVGEPHPGFLYPDPIGFWGEVRRWAAAVVGTRQPGWEPTEAVSVSALVHLDEHPERLAHAVATVSPHVVLFLDEPSFQSSGYEPSRVELHHVPDPHREGKVYQGFWGRLADGTIVGKSPQHPTMHRLYARGDMAEFLDACPTD